MKTTQQLIELLTTTATNLAEAANPELGTDDDGIDDIKAELAEALATDDTFLGNLICHLAEHDLERATDMIWEDGHHLAKAVAAVEHEIG